MTWRGQIPCHPVERAGCVYVEVPKAGCTSMKWALSAFKGGPPPEDEDIHRWFGYTHARNLGQLQAWLADRWQHEFRFTIVRDPIARFESFYWGLQDHERGCYGDINRYVLERFEADVEWFGNIHAVPQTLIIGTDLHLYDFIGRLEATEELEDRLEAALHTPVIVFPHMNHKGDQRIPLTDEATERLRTIYAQDFEVLGYG